MDPNPYESPSVADPQGLTPPNRGMFILAGVGAVLASAYWAALALLLSFGVRAGSVSGLQILAPCLLIGLYGYRGVQILKGDVAAARRIVFLHLLGAVFALFQMATRSGAEFVLVLQGIKVAINLFGAATAYLATRGVPQRVAKPDA